MIRGADRSRPWTTCGGARFRLRLDQGGKAAGAPGEIVDISSDGMVIACGDGGVNVTRVRAEGKVAASDFAASAELSAAPTGQADSISASIRMRRCPIAAGHACRRRSISVRPAAFFACFASGA